MELKEIALVRGRNGLFRVLKATDKSAVLKPIENDKGGVMAIPSQGVMLLAEMSIYTRGESDTVPLQEALHRIWKQRETHLVIDVKAEDGALRSFMKAILPEYNEDKVYVSDIRKLIRWYSLLLQYAPEAIQHNEPQTPAKAAPGAQEAKSAEKEAEPKQGKATSRKKESGDGKKKVDTKKKSKSA